MKPQIPDGYREATEDELKCLPEGARCWGPYSKRWDNSQCVGEPGARLVPYIVPVATSPVCPGCAICSPITAPSLAQEAQALVAGDRAQDYGDAKESFTRIAKLWSAYKGVEFTPTDVAAMMILLKVSRSKTSPGKRDTWVDIIGYAELGGGLA